MSANAAAADRDALRDLEVLPADNFRVCRAIEIPRAPRERYPVLPSKLNNTPRTHRCNRLDRCVVSCVRHIALP